MADSHVCLDYVCLDLETTGLDPKRDKIIEIGAVRVRAGEITARMETLVNPGRMLEERIVELTGISDKDLEGAPDVAEVLPELLAFIGDDILLGHSVLFDYSFVKKAAVNQRLSFEKEGIDTLKIARKFLADLESRSLGSLCDHFGIGHSAHRALADAEATTALYKKLTELFYEGNEADFAPGTLQYRARRETPITIPQKEQLYKFIDRHKIDIGCNINKLTRSEASRLMTRLLAEYGR
ncbi:MAG: 3'-5' exonuclease [Roseburia sp.]|nr:3'-5' exonuclease [Ruminococcus sp.]MCM1156347.1 3'-5' exonuclease [Roseburia sp.]MCM1241921.1 3'-5' exonuclease [Roseburia sp.]